jgi:hypothetical protein
MQLYAEDRFILPILFTLRSRELPARDISKLFAKPVIAGSVKK